ncbi:hypothetical protein PILCRDRAFT_732857 [Piloderma croceum F 1598]|uniref:Uncharacterized protein n=1 Tax=Piloderma croceum (strain F 1598) TaxID=765440 RepID=A0A0C3AH42_PILCF|nr:hypothetical protein PILCRDRAFT_732857 [Piloderma croceum F 1598]
MSPPASSTMTTTNPDTVQKCTIGTRSQSQLFPTPTSLSTIQKLIPSYALPCNVYVHSSAVKLNLAPSHTAQTSVIFAPLGPHSAAALYGLPRCSLDRYRDTSTPIVGSSGSTPLRSGKRTHQRRPRPGAPSPRFFLSISSSSASNQLKWDWGCCEGMGVVGRVHSLLLLVHGA